MNSMQQEIVRLNDELARLREQRDKFAEILRKMQGIYYPFICGESGPKGKDGLPEKITVCPAHGSEITAVYVKQENGSAPQW